MDKWLEIAGKWSLGCLRKRRRRPDQIVKRAHRGFRYCMAWGEEGLGEVDKHHEDLSPRQGELDNPTTAHTTRSQHIRVAIRRL